VLEEGLPPDTMLNVNVPDVPYDELGGMVLARMGRRNYEDEIVKRMDPRGRTYFWIGGSEPTHIEESGTDFEAIERGMVSITPLHRDLTNYEALRALKGTAYEL
jgi:5'-nucleotidase